MNERDELGDGSGWFVSALMVLAYFVYFGQQAGWF